MKQTSSDRFLDGRVIASQPLTGFRSGLDAVMVAAAVSARADDDVLELGSGAGIASLCLAARVPECRVYGIELFPDLVELARSNARVNRVEGRVTFEHGDVLDPPRDWRRDFNHAFCNPPFHDNDGERSLHTGRAVALQDAGTLGDWLVAGLKRVRAGGTMTAIIRADRIGQALGTLPVFGIVVFPLWPRVGNAAKRVIVQATKNSRAPFVLAAGLVLHNVDGRYTDDADVVLRNAGSLAVGSPRL